MNHPREDKNRAHWEDAANRVARRVNFGWWLETVSGPLLITAFAGAAILLVLRRMWRMWPLLPPWAAPACAIATVALVALAAWLWAARRFEKPSDALVRIEAAMRLRNALTAARAGVAPWPAPAGRVDAGVSWRWPRLIVPPLGALILLAAGFLIPISHPVTGATTPEQPQAWKQLSAELDRFTEQKLVDEKYLEETRKKLEELKSQPEDQWFSHSSLEATDSLKKAHASETESVARDLGRAGKALETLEKNAGSLTQAEKGRLADEFDQALKGLQSGAMKPNPELLAQMKDLDLKKLDGLSPEQLDQLRENMKNNADALQKAAGGEGGEDWSDELLAGDGEGEGQDGNGQNGPDGAGKGGVDRGPGHAPGVLGAGKDKMDIGKLTGLEAKDLSQATPGDLLELEDGEHQVDRAASGISAGGQAAATGAGGDRVWKESLDPAEQRTLKRFFE